MLVRTQILLEENQKLELEELARSFGISFSKMARESLEEGVKKVKSKKRTKNTKSKKENSGAAALLKWAKEAVKGPGDSEYDKYAYDL